MKLAFCIFKVFPHGGLQRDCLRILKAAVERGHDVHVFTRKWDVPEIPGVTVHNIRVCAFSNHGKAKAFVKKLDLNGFDRVVGFNRMPGLDVYFMGDVCFLEDARKHGFWYRFSSRFRTYAKFERAVCGPSSKTRIMTLTHHQKTMIQLYYQTQPERITVLHPGIEKNRIPTDPAIRPRLRAQFQLNDDDKMLLMIGSDFQRKGVDRMLNAYETLSKEQRQKTHLFVIGKGVSVSTDEANVHFLGPREDANEFYLAADLFCHPARMEAGGMVLVEALVARLPVLMTANVGYAPLITESGGGKVLSEPFEQRRFNKLLAQMLLEDLTVYKENIEEYLKNHNCHRFTEQVMSIIES